MKEKEKEKEKEKIIVYYHLPGTEEIQCGFKIGNLAEAIVYEKDFMYITGIPPITSIEIDYSPRLMAINRKYIVAMVPLIKTKN